MWRRRSRSAKPIVHISIRFLLRRPDVACDSPSSDAGAPHYKSRARSRCPLGLGDTGMGIEIDLLVFKAAPQPLDENVVPVPALAVHADSDSVALQRAGEIVTGELAALVGIEDLRPAVPRDRVSRASTQTARLLPAL